MNSDISTSQLCFKNAVASQVSFVRSHLGTLRSPELAHPMMPEVCDMLTDEVRRYELTRLPMVAAHAGK